MDFVKAIEKGIKAAEDKEANMQEIREIINQANKEIYEFCGMINGFIELKDGKFICNDVIHSISHNRNCGYPLILTTFSKTYEVANAEEFVDCIKSILSSSAYGTKIRRFKGDL